MTPVTVILVLAGVMLAVALLTVIAWFVYTAYLDRVERRLAARKGLYRELVAELATRDRALFEPIIHQMKTLHDLNALEAVLEEQARSATERPEWLLEVYDELGLVDKYIEKLRNARKWRDRAFAAELLGRVGSAKAVPALLETVQATRTEDSDVREIALRALARIADPRAVEPLLGALAGADGWLAPRIADILTRHGDAAVDPLIGLLSSTDHHPARAWAANVLGEVGAERAYPALVRGLRDPEDEVRAKAATALGRLGDRRAIGHLLDHLLTDPAPFVRVRIACTLGQFGAPEVIDRLVHALRDPAWWVRMRSVEALEQIGPPAEAPLLVAIDDPDPEIRARAGVALERLGVAHSLVRMVESGTSSSEAIATLTKLSANGPRELLAELLRHPSPAVREAVITGIRQAQRRDLAGELIQVAGRDAEPRVRALAFDALRALRLDSLDVALVGLADSDQLVRSAAIRLVGELGGRGAIELLRSRAADPEPGVRGAAVHALAAIGGVSAEPEMLRLLGDREPSVRAAAALAGGDAGLRTLAPALVDLLDDADESVRLAAARALGVLGEPMAVPALLRAFPQAGPDLREVIIGAVSRLDIASTPALVEALLESPDLESKAAVARTLGRVRSPAAVEALIQLTRSPEPAIRGAAIEALGRRARAFPQNIDAALRAIRGGLADPDDSVRARAVDAAARLGLEEEWRTLSELLQSDPSVQVRERAALAIGMLRVPGGEAALIAASRRTEAPEVRAAAALAAGAFDPSSLVVRVLEMPDDSAVCELLRQRLRNDPWYRLLGRRLSRVQELELRALAAMGPDEALGVLANAVRSTLVAGERVRLISGLTAFRRERSAAALLQIVREDPSPEVRTAALGAVGGLLDPDEVLALGVRALGDPSLMVRHAAIGLFSRVEPQQALPRLIRSLRLDDDPPVLAAAAELAEAHFAAFRDAPLVMALDTRQSIVLVRLARFIHHPDLPSMLLPLARSSWPEVRRAAAELWQHRPDVVEPDGLEGLVVDPVVLVRYEAAGAAAAAGRYDLLDVMTQDPDPSVRRQVAIALGRTAPVGKPGLAVLERLATDIEMSVRAAAYVARLLQGTPVPVPPGIDPKLAADTVREAADLLSLRRTARTHQSEDRRLAAALALALLQDDVAREVARTDPVPAIRHRVGSALELAMPELIAGSAQ